MKDARIIAIAIVVAAILYALVNLHRATGDTYSRVYNTVTGTEQSICAGCKRSDPAP